MSSFAERKSGRTAATICSDCPESTGAGTGLSAPAAGFCCAPEPVFRCWACSARFHRLNQLGAVRRFAGRGRLPGSAAVATVVAAVFDPFEAHGFQNATTPSKARAPTPPPGNPSCSSPAAGESGREAGPVRPAVPPRSRSTWARGFGTLGCTAILLKGVRSRVGVQTFPPFSAGLVEALLVLG